MKRRITFVHGSESLFDAEQLTIDGKSLRIQSLQAARQERWTVNLYDLPQELWLALKQLHELHIRWIPAAPQHSMAPFVSTISPGLHIFVAPQKDRVADRICPLLYKIFGGSLNCTLPEDVFTRTAITAERFASSASLHYYEYRPSVTNLVEYIREKICPPGDLRTCSDNAVALTEAAYIDLDYDTISQSLHMSAFWRAPPTASMWNEQITQPKGDAKVEIGVLASQVATRPEEISLGGYLITLGQVKKPSPALFSFPSRHHPSKSKYTTSFITPTGLHPTLRLTFAPTSPAPFESCALHTYITLPSSLFPDKYQFSQPNLLKSNNLASLRSLSPVAPDLEAPIWATQEWGSALLIEFSPPISSASSVISSASRRWHADIPLHLRYLPPSTESGHQNLTVPDPVVFWACPSNHEGAEFDTNPFDRTNLGYDGLFGDRTLFYHLRSEGEGVQVLEVPVLDVRQAGWVEAGTGLAILVGAGWVTWCLAKVALWGHARTRSAGDAAKKTN